MSIVKIIKCNLSVQNYIVMINVLGLKFEIESFVENELMLQEIYQIYVIFKLGINCIQSFVCSGWRWYIIQININ